MPKGVPRSGFRNSKYRTADEARSMSMMTSSSLFNLKPVVETPKNKYSVTERFEFLRSLTAMVGKGISPGLICSGGAGLGKSYLVNNTLKSMGLEDVSTEDHDESIPNTYRVIKGTSTAKGLYKALYQNRNNILILDDADDAFKDTKAINLLKGALDTNDERVITWMTGRDNDDLPSSFEYNGGVIFITNEPSEFMDNALRSRCMIVDLSMTDEERIEHMWTIVGSDEFLPGYSLEYKMDAISLLDSLGDKLKELSLRTLIKTIKIRSSDDPNWSNIAEFMLI